jgi:hypothetical protein
MKFLRITRLCVLDRKKKENEGKRVLNGGNSRQLSVVYSEEINTMRTLSSYQTAFVCFTHVRSLLVMFGLPKHDQGCPPSVL